MAENQDNRSRDDLTEEASPYRIEESRRKGIVAQSRELSGLAVLLATGVTAYAFAPRMATQISEFMQEVFRADVSSRINFSSLDIVKSLIIKSMKLTFSIGLPVCAAGFIIGIAASFAQVGGIFSVEPLTPDLSKIDPIQGIRRLFSLRHLTDSLRLILKMFAIVGVTFFLIRSEVFESYRYLGIETADFFGAYGAVAKPVFLVLVLILAVFAAADFGLQRWEHGKSLKMTKQEAKQEHKEREGDPQIKARIRSIQREMARRRMMQAVKKADVVVTNPTHIAVALVYEGKAMFAPKVVAKGADLIAQKIKHVALEAGIPMVENVPLARTLFKSVKVGHFIPKQLYQAVAEVLAYVYRLKRKEL